MREGGRRGGGGRGGGGGGGGGGCRINTPAFWDKRTLAGIIPFFKETLSRDLHFFLPIWAFDDRIFSLFPRIFCVKEKLHTSSTSTSTIRRSQNPSCSTLHRVELSLGASSNSNISNRIETHFTVNKNDVSRIFCETYNMLTYRAYKNILL